MTNDVPELAIDLSQQPLMRDSRCPFHPAPALRDLQANAPITATTMPDGSTAWVVTRHEDAKALLGDPRVSSNPASPGFAATGRYTEPDENSPRFFIQLDDPEHAELRMMATGPFTVKSVRAASVRVEEVINGLIDDLLAGPNPTDFVEAFALPLPSFMICDILGAPYDERHVFQETTRVVVNAESTPQQRDAAQAELAMYLGGLFQRKAAEPADDLFSKLAEHVAAGDLSMQEVIGMGIMLLIAGHETTANTTALGLLALLQNPDQLQLLREHLDDDKFVANAVEELLRYTSVVREPMRRAILEDIEFKGLTLSAGDGLLIPLDIANRDPDVYDDPHTLDLTRKARNHIAFGFGVHQCVGQQLARLELTLAFKLLLQRIPTLELAIGAEQANFNQEAVVYALKDLPIRW